jgi:hypothetical protein
MQGFLNPFFFWNLELTQLGPYGNVGREKKDLAKSQKII